MSTDESTPDTATIETTTSPLTFPDGFEMGQSWQRAQTERNRGGWINDAERMVWFDDEQDERAVRALGDVRQTHLSRRWWT
ncbi:hypothetical protein GRX03_06035 [Halovenus sp. WSH3]|uniref:Uncharacterized protein n=1 Tax=Halovenus carboxidivorans TaxID=2692199 RepID=A0A6B0T034_9EURY|nr:hypothetical protein [Halovenus carboxidivorans]MXR51165.1 hypothetical protein [Halovenus carboxidivorans]